MKLTLRSAIVLATLLAVDASARVARLDRFGGTNIDCKDSSKLDSALKSAAASAVMVILKDSGAGDAPGIYLTTLDLCPDNSIAPATRFRVKPPTCSGIMISKRRLATAAHCLLDTSTSQTKQIDLQRIEVLANYARAFGSDVVTPGDNDVATASKVLYCRKDPQTDVAIVELDKLLAERVVGVRAPQKGEAAHLVSFPLGYPLTINTCINESSDCVQPTVKNVSTTMFQSPLDSFRGSSGGGVFGDDGRLIGVFRGGAPQLQVEPTCLTDRVYSNGCDGDLVSRLDGLDADLFDDNKVLPAMTCSFGDDPTWPICTAESDSGPVTGGADCSNAVQ